MALLVYFPTQELIRQKKCIFNSIIKILHKFIQIKNKCTPIRIPKNMNHTDEWLEIYAGIIYFQILCVDVYNNSVKLKKVKVYIWLSMTERSMFCKSET